MAATAEPIDVRRVSTLELFFDLVFVFTITQLTKVLHDEGSWTGLLQVLLMLGVIFWMYGGYAWLTNAVAPDRMTRQLLLLGGMAGYLVLALCIPRAFDDGGTAFGLAYVAIVSIHAGLFIAATPVTVSQAIRGLAPYNLVTAALVLAGGIAGGTAQYVLWTAAFVGEWISGKLIDSSGFEIGASHFVERHGLVIIVALGESIVAIGIGASELPIDLKLAFVAVLGMALVACLWWVYFGSDEGGPERALSTASSDERPRLALDAFGYAYLALLLGIIAAAAGLEEAVAHPFDALKLTSALELAGGVALFLAGDVVFRHVLGLGRLPWRVVAALAALATIPLGTEVAATAQVGGLLAVLVLALALETAGAGARRAPAGQAATGSGAG
jgi:low temperature requirement protein LtrA